MSYDRHIAALSFGDLKTAALYFDRVLPLAFASIRGDARGLVLYAPDPIPIELAAQLIFGQNAPRHLIISWIDDYWHPFMKQLRPLMAQPRNSQDPSAYDELKRLYLSNAAVGDKHSVRDIFRELARRLAIESYAVLLPEENSENTGFSEAYACLALLDVPLIDPSNASWEQILEVRRSAEASRKLRRLRLFFFENYSGKPRSYVEDDLLRRLDDYERVRREFGFDTVLSAISVVLDAKNLQAAVVAGLTAALFGGPSAGFTVGATVEVGKVAIAACQRIAQIRRLRDGHELAYLIDARQRVG